MDREKQIEELASLLAQYEYKLCKRLPKNKCLLTSKIHAQVCCDYCKIAEFLINLGYCKITDNEVVISKAEYNELRQAKTLLEFREETMKLLEDANIRYAEALELKVNIKERKETAEKYHNFVNNSIKNVIKMYSIGNLKTANIKDICSTINLDNNEIAKQFGVEIKE